MTYYTTNPWFTDNISTTSTGEIWYNWCNSTAITDSEYAQYINSFTWGVWQQTNTSGSNAVIDTSWSQWNGRFVNLQQQRLANQQELARIQEAERVRREVQAKMSAEAEERAQQLLLRLLNPVQRAEFEQDRCFHVVASDGSMYRIEISRRHQNVYKLDQAGNAIEELCAYQPGTPVHDSHVAQKLMLETDVKKFRAVSNIRPVMIPPRRQARPNIVTPQPEAIPALVGN